MSVRATFRSARWQPSENSLGTGQKNMSLSIADVVDLTKYPFGNDNFRSQCKGTLDDTGVLVMPDFLTAAAISAVKDEGDANQHLAFYTVDSHNVYLTPPDENYPLEHPRNRQVASSKGCIASDQIPHESALRTLYESSAFRKFLCSALGERELHEYADPLASINLHYADEAQELGWHFDNSSFAITLMIQRPEGGGVFEYVKNVRDADNGEMNFERAGEVLDGRAPVQSLKMDAGTLVLFRGRNSMHRVTPVTGDRTRMLVVLAYNTKPGVSLSESARKTFFGRLG
jgi:hypothetical protein